MEFQEEHTAFNVISGYNENSVTVNDQVFYQSVLVALKTAVALTVTDVGEITPEMMLSHVDPAIECVLIGLPGARTHYPIEVIAAFQQKGYGCEIMTREAACRTFNIMAADQRKVVAILLI